jgi:hypothetical protein
MSCFFLNRSFNFGASLAVTAAAWTCWRRTPSPRRYAVLGEELEQVAVSVGSSAWSSGATAVAGAGVLAASAGEAASFGSATAGRRGQKHRMGIRSFSSGLVERREY